MVRMSHLQSSEANLLRDKKWRSVGCRAPFSAPARAPRSFRRAPVSSGRAVALNTCHLLLKLVPHRLVDAADIELRCDVPDKAFEDTVKVLAPAFGSCLRAGHADQREPFRQHLGARARL